MKSKYHLTLLSILCFFMFFGQLDVIPPDLMESRNLVTAREMVQEGNWWHTTMNLEPRHEKPPLPTWITAITMRIGGGFDNLYLLRLPSALIGTLMVMFFYGFCFRYTKSRNLAFIAGAVMATNFMILSQARINTWDIYTHAFMVGTLWAFLEGIERKKWRYHYLAALLFAMSFMSKGPVSLYTVWLPFLMAYMLIAKQSKFDPTKLKPILFITSIGLLLGAFWYLSMYLTDQNVAQAIFEKELSGWGNRHPRPFYFYLHLPIFMGIWIFPFLAFLFPRYALAKIKEQVPYRQILMWILFTLVLLSLVPTKKERYLLPIMIPSSLAIASMIHALYYKIRSGTNSNIDRYLFYSAPILVAIASIVISIHFIFSEENSNNFIQIFSCITLQALASVTILLVLKNSAKYTLASTFIAIGLFSFSLFAKSQMLFEGNPKLNSLSEVKNKIDLTNKKFYALQKDLDPRMIWLLGQNVYSSEGISFTEEENFPLIYLSYVPIEEHFSQEILKKLEVEFNGKYDIRPQESKWQAHVYELTWRKN